MEVLLQTMLLLDARHEGYDYKAISTREVTKYCKHIRGNYDDGKRRMMEEIVDYLGETFPEKHKFLKKSNVPMVMVLAKIALEHDVSSEDFKRLLDEVNEMPFPAYTMHTGSGNVKREKTEGRLVALQDVLAGQLGLGGVSILRIENDTSLANLWVSVDENESVELGQSEDKTSLSESSKGTEEPLRHSEDDAGEGQTDA